jgi:histidinol-phosphatase (PHP family)
MIVSYHNHTRWSDGACSVTDQVEAAKALGLGEVGISDHYVLSPSGKPIEWSMPLDRLGEYVAEVREAAATASGIAVRIGIEADYFPETVETLRSVLALHPFDYVIGSVHYVNGFPIDGYARDWESLTPEAVVDTWRLYWTRIGEMAESRVYDFAAHLDLPKKFGFRPSADLTREVNTALDALAAADMAIEINTAGWSLPAKEAYPSLDLLREARSRDIPLLINADAHTPRVLTRSFVRARALAREAGYSELSRYHQRQRYPIPLSG